MAEDERHGALLMDEMKLSEGINFNKNSLKIEGFVNLGEQKDKNILGDHALVLMYQPFKGRWMQTIGAFLTRGAAKGKDLAKLGFEALVKLNQAGFHVDAVVTDGAPWNRTMWNEFGMLRLHDQNDNGENEDEDNILSPLFQPEEWEQSLDLNILFPDQGSTATSKRKSSKGGRPKTGKKKSIPKASNQKKFVSVEHPCDPKKRLWFMSDFPHLVKSVKERILKNKVLQTPDGVVKLDHWKALYEEDSKKGIRIAPKLSLDHFSSEGYLAMRVKLAFSMFSEQVASAMEHYSRRGVHNLEDCAATVKFIRRMNKLIDAMNANSPFTSIRPKDQNESLEVEEEPPYVCPDCEEIHSEYGAQSKKTPRQCVEEFLAFLDEWEHSGLKREKRLTSQTAFGLKVSLSGALELCDYLASHLGFRYLMTKRLNQDALEHFFGKMRQSCGANAHPDPLQFIQVYRLLSVGSLIKPPRGSNITGAEMLDSLLNVKDLFTADEKLQKVKMEKMLDEALDAGETVDYIDRALGDHTYNKNKGLDDCALGYFAGYVARTAKRISTARECKVCFDCLCKPRNTPHREIDAIIHARSKGYLLHPSDELFKVIHDVEEAVLQTLDILSLKSNIIMEVLEHVKTRKFAQVGCAEHSRQLTKDIISFYLKTRLIFACKDFNRYYSECAAKKRKAKHLLKLQRLTA